MAWHVGGEHIRRAVDRPVRCAADESLDTKRAARTGGPCVD